LWCYYGISILFFGAEYVQVLERKRSLGKAPSKTEDSVGPNTSKNPDRKTVPIEYHKQSADSACATEASEPMEAFSHGSTKSEVGRILVTGESKPQRIQPRRANSHH
jgi:hypothetical protein